MREAWRAGSRERALILTATGVGLVALLLGAGISASKALKRHREGEEYFRGLVGVGE